MSAPQFKAGDRVIVEHSTFSAGWRSSTIPHVRRVERATPTQALVAGSRFRRADGAELGRFANSRIRLATPAEIAEHDARAEALNAISQTAARGWGNLTTEQLVAIAAACEVTP